MSGAVGLRRKGSVPWIASQMSAAMALPRNRWLQVSQLSAVDRVAVLSIEDMVDFGMLDSIEFEWTW